MNGRQARAARRAVRVEAKALMASPALTDVAVERSSQDAKWGEQNHLNGTGPQVAPPGMVEDVRAATEKAFKQGVGSWRHILSEEVMEAFAENDPSLLRQELVQTAAVAVAWIECIDRQAEIEAEL